jgi:hypothetical protein
MRDLLRDLCYAQTCLAQDFTGAAKGELAELAEKIACEIGHTRPWLADIERQVATAREELRNPSGEERRVAAAAHLWQAMGVLLAPRPIPD